MRINGLKVVDANKSARITITKRDIATGKSKDPGSCAAARACVRQKLCTEARVHLGRTYLKQDNKWVRYMTGRALRTEIISFDRGAKFQPGDFMLYKITPSKVATGKAQGSTVGKDVPYNKRGQRPRKYHTVTGVRQHGANR